MPRYALQIEYNGTPFSGWQRQIDRPSVQGTIEAALTKVDPACPKITGAGRTDAGVHATGQVAHVDLDREWNPFRLMEAVNFHLKPNPIAIVACVPVAEEWHARFSASERRYMFRMVARRAPLVQDAGWVWQVKQEMDVEAMRAGAAMLVGDHDFSTFRASHCQARSPFKTMDRCDIEVVPLPFGTEFRFHVWARSFLHNQVRSIVGTLERVGAGSWTPQDVRTALEARDRTACGPVSPPEGLYLVKVAYADDPFA